MARKAAKRELIEPRKGDKRYVRRKAKTVAKKGQGDRGDAKPRKTTASKKKAGKSRR